MEVFKNSEISVLPIGEELHLIKQLEEGRTHESKHIFKNIYKNK